MRKSKLLAGTYNVYATFDKISKHYKDIIYAVNDETLIKVYLPRIVLGIPLRELSIFKIGIFNDVTGELTKTVHKRVNIDCYEFPHSRLSPPGENLSKEEIEKELLETKNKIIAESSTPDEDEAKEA